MKSCLSSSAAKYLLVGVPGGSYTTDYFDADDNHSVRPISEALGIPVIGINRPGYDATPGPIDLDKADNSFIQKSGRWLNELALPAIWTEYAEHLGIESIVLYGHSIGAAVCVVAAGEYEKAKAPYKLSGLALAGVGSDPVDTEFGDAFEEEHKLDRPLPLKGIKFPVQAQQHFMLGDDPQIYDPAILKQTARLQNNIYLQELYDIEYIWPIYWQSYAQLVTVPVLYNAGEMDLLWKINRDTVHKFGEAFSNSAWVSLILSPGAPHAIEHSRQAFGYYLRLLGFAAECATQSAIKRRRGGQT